MHSVRRSPVLVAAVMLAVLPFALLAGGLTMTSATDVVIFAIACMALNILVGHTGLVSFGHGAWFGIGAYAAALTQLHWFRGSVLWPTLFAVVLLLISSIVIGFLVLRRRGVYFSLLTLALSALVYSVAFRWTAFTGGENGLGGLTRANWLGADLENRWWYYGLVALCGLAVVYGLSRFHRSPIGTVLNAIRENEQRAQFVGYATPRYKLVAFVLSCRIDGLRRSAVRISPSLRLRRSDRRQFFRRAAGDGDHRRHAQPARSGTGCAFLHPVSRIPVDLDATLALVLWPVVHGFHRFLPEWSGRCLAAADGAAAQEDGRGGGDGRSGYRAWRATARVPEATRGRRRSCARGARTGQVLRRHPCVARCECRSLGAFAARADRPQRRWQDDSFQPDLGPICTGQRPGHVGGRRCDRRAALPDRGRRARALIPDHEPLSCARRAGKPAARRSGTTSRVASTVGPRLGPWNRSCAKRRNWSDSSDCRASSAPKRGPCRTAVSGCSTWGLRSPPRRACCCSMNRLRAWLPPSESASGS